MFVLFILFCRQWVKEELYSADFFGTISTSDFFFYYWKDRRQRRERKRKLKGQVHPKMKISPSTCLCPRWSLQKTRRRSSLLAVTAPDVAADLQLRNDLWHSWSQGLKALRPSSVYIGFEEKMVVFCRVAIRKNEIGQPEERHSLCWMWASGTWLPCGRESMGLVRICHGSYSHSVDRDVVAR